MAFVEGHSANYGIGSLPVWLESGYVTSGATPIDPDYNAGLVPYRKGGRVAGGYEYCWRISNVSGWASPQFAVALTDGIYSFLFGTEGVAVMFVATEWSLYAADGTKIVRIKPDTSVNSPALNCACGDALATSAVTTDVLTGGVVQQIDIRFKSGAAGRFEVRINLGAWFVIVADGNATTCTKDVSQWYAHNNNTFPMDLLAFWYGDDPDNDDFGLVWSEVCPLNAVSQAGSYAATTTTIPADTAPPYNQATAALTLTDPPIALKCSVDWATGIEAGFAPPAYGILAIDAVGVPSGDGSLLSCDIGVASGGTGVITTDAVSVTPIIQRCVAVVDPDTGVTWDNTAGDAALVTMDAS